MYVAEGRNLDVVGSPWQLCGQNPSQRSEVSLAFVNATALQCHQTLI